MVSGRPDSADSELDHHDHGEAADESSEEGVDDVFGEFDLIDGGEDSDYPDSGYGDSSDRVTSSDLRETGAEHAAYCVGHQAGDDDDGDSHDHLGDEADKVIQCVADCIVSEGAERHLEYEQHDQVVEDLGDESAAVGKSCSFQVATKASLVNVGIEVNLAEQRDNNPADPLGYETANKQYDQEDNQLGYETHELVESARECFAKLQVYCNNVHVLLAPSTGIGYEKRDVLRSGLVARNFGFVSRATASLFLPAVMGRWKGCRPPATIGAVIRLIESPAEFVEPDELVPQTKSSDSEGRDSDKSAEWARLLYRLMRLMDLMRFLHRLVPRRRLLVRMLWAIEPGAGAPLVKLATDEDVSAKQKGTSQAKQGDPEQLHNLVVEHADAVYRLAYSVVRDSALAEDVAQDTMVKAWIALPTFRGDSSLRSWIMRIAHNTAISTLRTRRAMVTDPADMPERASISERTVERKVEGDEAMHAFIKALDLLDELSRSIVVLREVEGMAYDEISRVLNVPLPTVKTRLLRARRRLSAALKEWE